MAVQYVKFALTDPARAAIQSKRGPVSLGVDHPAYRAVSVLGDATLASLADDFD
jgi:hypothetical protein